MHTATLQIRIFRSFLLVILLLGASIALFGSHVINSIVIERAQKQLLNDMKVAHLVYNNELDVMKRSFDVIRYVTNIEELRIRLALDYLFIIGRPQADASKSELVRTAFKGESVGGTRVIERAELEAMGGDIYRRCEIAVKSTPKSRPSALKTLDRALAIEYAKPLFDSDGVVTSVLCGGKLINRNFALVNKIRDSVFENKLYRGKPVGTVTIFLDDTRIATNVLDEDGKLAVGTRVSQTVYENVVERGRSWLDRAFVVTDWYLTAYEPIRDAGNNIVGILYVGILEKPFSDLRRNILLVFSAIIAGAVVMATVISVVIGRTISHPFGKLTEATERISAGQLHHRIKPDRRFTELNRLALSFNDMARKLNARERKLRDANHQLAELNKSYLDLIGFVSHELKGMLGSIVMNVYSLKDGFLGPLNEKQQKAVDSSARSLDHFESVVKNYLDLSRIEKGELELHPSAFDLCDALIRPAMEHFEKQAAERKIAIENRIAPGIAVRGDRNLLAIVCNNLLGNAVKYGEPGGRIVLEADVSRPDLVSVGFYNDGVPIPARQVDLLFRKFSRLPGSEKTKGTGLGLFIVKQIVEKHGGVVRAEPQEKGNKFVFTIQKES